MEKEKVKKVTSEEIEIREKFFEVRNTRIAITVCLEIRDNLLKAYDCLNDVYLDNPIMSDTVMREKLIDAKRNIEHMIADYSLDEQYWRERHHTAKNNISVEEREKYHKIWHYEP